MRFTSWQQWAFKHLDAAYEYTPLTSSMAWIEVAAIVAFNFCYWPACVVAFSRGHMHAGTTILFSFTTAILFQFGALSHASIMATLPSQWHRLNNIFQIGALQAVAFATLLPAPHAPAAQFLQWMCLCVTIMMQEVSPWSTFTTVFPIVVPLCIALVAYYSAPAKQRPQFNEKLTYGFFSCGAAVVLFLLAAPLADVREVQRLLHGVCKAMLGASFALWLSARKESAATAVKSSDKHVA
jgi:hypothetical protein